MITASERRNFPRMATECAASYRLAGTGSRRDATIKNISAGGMLLLVRDEIGISTTLELRVAPGHLSIPMLSAVVEVMRSAPAPGKGACPGYEVGVRVLSMK